MVRNRDSARRQIEPKAFSIVDEAYRRGEPSLGLVDSLSICQHLGVPIAPFAEVTTDEDVESAGQRVGFPVMLKVDARGIVHKKEVGGVIGPINDLDALHEALHDLRGSDVFQDDPDARFVVQQHCKGIELIVGVFRHGSWGPVLVVGLGGEATEILGEVTYLPVIAGESEVTRALQAMRIGPLFEAFRGEPPVDLSLVANTATLFAALASSSPIIYEIEANPFMVTRGQQGPQGVVDVRIMLRGSMQGDERGRGGR